MSALRIASAQFPVSEPSSWAEYEDSLSEWVGRACAQSARLLVFPEYAALSLAALFSASVRADLSAQLHELQTLRESYLALHRRLAADHGVYLLAGSFPWQVASGRFHNRAWLCSPQGAADFQDKQIMTRFEREHWSIDAGEPLKVFDTALGRIGVAICYDSEFPLIARAQIEAGAQLLLVPSCTDGLAGYHRVRIGARARALEGQCYTVLSPLVGEAPWSPAIDINVGAAGIFGPPDRGFPDHGVIKEGTLNQAMWLVADIDLDAIDRVRREGQVLNHRHWNEQPAATAARASTLF